MENSELYGQIKSNAEEMAAVDEIARILTSTLDINQFYDHFAAEVKQLVAFDRIGIGIIDQSNGTYSMNYTAGLEVTGAPAEAILSLDGSLTEHLIQTHKTHIRSNMSDSDQYGSIDERRVDAGIRSAIAVPLISSGRVVAALSLVSLEIDAYGPREQRIMERLVSQIAPAIENAQLYEQTKLAGEATRVSEEKYRTLVNESPDMIFVSRIDDYRITEVNDRACEQYGYSVKEFQAMNIIDLEIEPPLPEQVRSLYDNTPIGQVVEVYGINKRIDGTTFPVHVRFAKLDNVFAIANVRDITDQRTAEQALQESEARFRQIAENMNQVVSLIDHKDFKYLYVNDAYEEIWGQPCQNLYDNPKTWLEAVHPDDHSRVEAVLNNQHEQEFRIIRPDGTVRWIFGRSFPIHDEAGEVYRLVGICEDITERKETEERMHETARLAAIGELAAGVAHEINNPLTGVLGYSELLLAEDWPKQAREDLQRVHSNAQRAAKVVQNLLSFSRKQGFRARYTDLTPIVARVLDMKSYDLTTSNIQVTQELSPDLPHTMMDEHQLIQAIIVLLTNAEQSLRGFRRDGSVVIRTTRSETHIRLSVTDNGPGIAPEVLTRIFEPFFTTKEVGEGTGLGLSICYGIVRQHNGKIWAESVPGEGATFHIELPIMGPEDENDLPPHDEHRQTHASAGHLLVVDDEPHIRDLLVRVLEQERYTVDLAKEGEEAWNMLMERSYDCIVLDLKMPGVCGRELYQRINESNYELARKVIFITGDTISNNTLDFILSTGNLVVSKPLDMDVLLMQVRKCLEATRNAR